MTATRCDLCGKDCKQGDFFIPASAWIKIETWKREDGGSGGLPHKISIYEFCEECAPLLDEFSLDVKRDFELLKLRVAQKTLPPSSAEVSGL